MSSIIRIVDCVNKWILVLIGVLISLMAIVLSYQVFSRFVLGVSSHWSEEFARLLMAYSIFLGAALALRYQKLIMVDFFVEKLPQMKKKILRVITYCLTLAFFVLLFLTGIEMLGKVQSQQSAALKIPMSVFYGCLPAGSLLAILNSVIVIIELFIGKDGEE